MMRATATAFLAVLLALPLAATAVDQPTALAPAGAWYGAADPVHGAEVTSEGAEANTPESRLAPIDSSGYRAPEGATTPTPDASGLRPADWTALPGAAVATARFALPAGTAAFAVRIDASGQAADVQPAATGALGSGLPSARDIAVCTPSAPGLHYTTTPDQHETCPFTRHDGPIHESLLVCAVGGDCTLAGQDVPTGGTFWVICYAVSGSAQAWGTLHAVDVQCDSGMSGTPPNMWTHWSSWCRVFGPTGGAAACAHTYG